MKRLTSRMCLATAASFFFVLGSPLTDSALAQDQGARGNQQQGQGQGQRGDRGDRGDQAQRGQRGQQGQQGQAGRGWGGRGGDGGRGGNGGRGGRGGQGGIGGGMWGGMGQTMRPYFVRRDMPMFNDELELDSTQASIVETLILDYESRFEESLDAMRERMGELRPQNNEDPEITEKRNALRDKMREQFRSFQELRRNAGEDGPDEAQQEELREQMRAVRAEMEELRPPRPEPEEMARIAESFGELYSEWTDIRNQLNAELLGNVQVILSEQQLEDWTGFERTVRRQKTISDGRLSGERVDLIQVVKQMPDVRPEMEAIEDVLESYSIALDAALVRRNDFSEESRTELMAAFSTQNFTEALDVMETMSRNNVAVRDINRSYSEIISSAMSDAFNDEVSAQFQMAYLERAFDNIYRPSAAGRSFDVALAFEDLDPEVLEGIQELQVAYNIELQSMNNALMAATLDYEPTRMTNFIESRIARMNGEDIEQPANPVRELETEKRDFDQRYRDQLEAMLTPEQIEELPPMRGRGWGGQGGQGGQRGFGGMSREDLMKRFDKDGDGELSRDERDAAREAMRLMRDNNGDDI